MLLRNSRPLPPFHTTWRPDDGDESMSGDESDDGDLTESQDIDSDDSELADGEGGVIHHAYGSC